MLSYDHRVLLITNDYSSGSKDFTTTVQALLDAYVAKDTQLDSMSPLLSALGCRHVCTRLHAASTFEAPAQPDAAHEVLITKTLLCALRLHTENQASSDPHKTNNCAAILDGLARNNRWRTCLDSISSASDLAVLLLQASSSFVGFNRNSRNPHYELVESCIPAMLKMLNEWLRPSLEFSRRTALSEVARAMYGDAWYDLTFGGEVWFDRTHSNNDDVRNRAVMAYVHRNRPTFRRNLLNAIADEQERMELPDFGTPLEGAY